jgi:hypothetical protein
MRVMSCFKPSILNSKLKGNLAFYYIPEMLFKCNINKDKLIDIIKVTFAEKCKFSAFGFNKSREQFWAKKFSNNKFMLHFTLNIIYSDLYTSNIVINLLIADDTEVTKLLSVVESIIIMHQSKTFIKL